MKIEAQSMPQKPGLIRDTDTAEGKESADAEKPKTLDPVLAQKNLKIGDYYLKKNNLAAAIGRYLEAIDYQPNMAAAHDALGRAYEKNGETSKAIQIYERFIKENPQSPMVPDFQSRLNRLQKKKS